MARPEIHTPPDLTDGDTLAYTIKHGQDDPVYLRRQVNPAMPGRVNIATPDVGGSTLTELDALCLVDGVLDLLGVRRDRGKLAAARTELHEEIKRLREDDKRGAAARRFRESQIAVGGPAGVELPRRPWHALDQAERDAWQRREQAAAELYRGQS